MSGQKIIDRGEVITPSNYRVLTSFEKETKRRSSTEDELTTTIIGQVLFIFLLVIMFTSYLTLFRKDYFDKPRSITMLYAMITLFPIFVSLIMKHNFFSVYIIPFAMAYLCARVHGFPNGIHHPCHDDSHLCGCGEIPVRVYHRTAGIRSGCHLQPA